MNDLISSEVLDAVLFTAVFSIAAGHHILTKSFVTVSRAKSIHFATKASSPSEFWFCTSVYGLISLIGAALIIYKLVQP